MPSVRLESVVSLGLFLASNKVMKLFPCVLLLPGLCLAAILPDAIGPYQRGLTTQLALSDRPVWDEYGLKDFETVAYVNGASRFTATAYQLQDTTGSLAAFDWQRPEHSTPSKLAALAVETADSLLLVHGNYLLAFTGYKPSQPELDEVATALKHVDRTSLPMLPGYMPEADRVGNSERYIIGPASLQKFSSRDSRLPWPLSTSVPKAEMAVFHSAKGDTAVAIFNYPTSADRQAAGRGIREIAGRHGQAMWSFGGRDPGSGRPGFGRTRARAGRVIRPT